MPLFIGIRSMGLYSISISFSISIYPYIYIYLYLYLYIYIYIYAYMGGLLYEYRYIHIHIHIHTYIYIYIYIECIEGYIASGTVDLGCSAWTEFLKRPRRHEAPTTNVMAKPGVEGLEGFEFRGLGV